LHHINQYANLQGSEFMLQLPHTTVGLLIAYSVKSPIALPIALLSHFALDLIPHWDFFTNGKELFLWRKIAILTDFLLSVGIGLLYFKMVGYDPYQVFIGLGCCVMANLPDVLEIPYFLNWKNRLTTAVLKIQSFFHWRCCFPWGLLPQVLLVLWGVFLLFFVKR